MRAPGCSGCWRHGVSHNVEWSDFKRAAPFHFRQYGAVRRVTLWGMRGVRVGEASHTGPRCFSWRTQEHHLSRSRSVGGGWWRGRFHASDVFGRGHRFPRFCVATPRLRFRTQPIWDGSSDGEPLVRPNNGRHVASSAGQEHVLWKVLSL